MTDEQARKRNIEIIDFKTKFSDQFRDINYDWLEKYFEVEPYDRIVLNDPQGQVIKRGGYIFMARVDDKIVGTCALLKHTDKKYELAKMGVYETHQGLGIGRLLTKTAIDKARQVGGEVLVLATSRLLPAANKLYQSMGFKETDIDAIGPLPYRRESIVMVLDLQKEQS